MPILSAGQDRFAKRARWNVVDFQRHMPSARVGRSVRWMLKCAAIAVAVAAAPAAQAQVQRSFLNLGFEEPVLPPDCTHAQVPDFRMEGWKTTHPFHGGSCNFEAGQVIEVWKSGNLGVTARNGNQFAELNAFQASRLYQTVCLLPGETIDWRLSHRGRDGEDTMNFKLGADDANIIAQMRTGWMATGTILSCGDSGNISGNNCATPAPATGGWTDYSGSFTWGGAASDQEVSFEAVSTASLISNGNFLDDIQLEGLKPFVELQVDTASGREGGGDDFVPKLLVSGDLPAPLTVSLSIAGGTATLGEDFRTPGNAADFEVTIQPGTYASHEFPLEIEILPDDTDEPDETIVIEVNESPNGEYLLQSTRICGGDPVTTSTYTIQDEHVQLLKSFETVDGTPEVGDVIKYTFVVENTGGVDLTNVTFDDPYFTISNTYQTLPRNEKQTFTVDYTLTQDDFNKGRVDNQATVQAFTPDGNKVTDLSDDPNNGTEDDPEADGEPDDRTVLELEPNAELDITKIAELDDDGSGYADAGETITYRFTVKNTGNVTLTDVKIDDPSVTVSGGSIPKLEPEETDTDTFTATKTLTQDEIDARSFENTATGTGTAPDDTQVTAQSHAEGEVAGTPTVYEVEEKPDALTLTKTGTLDQGDDGRADVGDVITYELVVKNTGNVTVRNVMVSDPKLEFSDGPVELAPNDERKMTVTYTLTQKDIDDGMVDNVAKATGQSAHGTDLEAEASWSQATAGVPEVDFIKEAVLENDDGDDVPEVGDKITYTFTIINNGNVTLSELTIEDEDVEVTGDETLSLKPQQSDNETFTGTRTITQEDIDEGKVENVATLRGEAPDGTKLEKKSRTSNGVSGDPTVTLLAAKPAIRLELVGELVDTNENEYPDAGEEIAYRIKVFNAGNVTLKDVDVEGLLAQAPDGPASLPLLDIKGKSLDRLDVQATDTGTFTARYTISQEDIDKGLVLAQARVRGIAPDGSPVEDLSDDPEEGADVDLNNDEVPDDPVALVLAQKAALEAAKAGELQDDNDSGFADAGETILYTVTVTNSGNVTMLDVAPEDEGPRFDGAPGAGSLSAFQPPSVDKLAPGAQQAFTAVYTLAGADVERAQGLNDGVVNRAGAKGGSVGGQEATAEGATSTVTIPGLSVTKVAQLAEVWRGGQVPYVITVTPINLSAPKTVTVVDVMPAGFSYLEGTASVDGVPAVPEVEGRSLFFEGVTLAPDAEVTIRLSLGVSAAASPGKYVNRARVLRSDGAVLSRDATAEVEVVTEPVFDCGDVVGKVFDDVNRNGYQDAGEPGLAGVRVTTVEGLRITTDKHGRFHVTCADLPDPRIGTTYIMKLDPRTLPSGYRVVSENPRVVRLTAGKASRINFAATISRVVRLSLGDTAFEPDSLELKPEWRMRLSQLITTLGAEESVLRLAYFTTEADRRLAANRTRHLRRTIAQMWKEEPGRYRLEIETRIQVSE